MRIFPMLGLLVSASLLPAVSALALSSEADAVAANPKEKMICKRTQRTGTRFYKQICKTAAQWDAISEQHRRDLHEMVDRPQIEIRKE